jgi:G3E family GTPase
MCIFCERAAKEASGSDPLLQLQVVEAEGCARLRGQRLPVTIITGFLGSGKTTLLNYILTAAHGKKFAVLENEVGSVAIDDSLIVGEDVEVADGPEVLLMPNGCLCCKSRGDLADALKRILERHVTSPVDGIIVELSGAADVPPVIQTFFTDPSVQSSCRMDAVLCVADSSTLYPALVEGSKSLSAQIELALAQLAWADILVLNKVDLLAGEGHADKLEEVLTSMNRTAEAVQCTLGQAPLDRLIGTGSFSLVKVLEDDEAFLSTLKNAHHHKHQSLGVESVGCELHGCINWPKLAGWLEAALKEADGAIWRCKGILCTEGARKVVLQGVGGRIETEEAHWPLGRPHRSRIIFIGPLTEDLKQKLTGALEANKGTPRVTAPPKPSVKKIVSPPRRAPIPQSTGAAIASVKFGGGGGFEGLDGNFF